MQVTIEDLSPVEKKLAVEIPWEDVKAKLDEAYRELGRGAQLKGFRRGKVPRSILERMYGKQVENEVMKELVRDSMVQATDEHHLKPVAEPVLEEEPLQKGEPFRYSARIEIRPAVTPKDYFDIPLVRKQPVVTDEQLEHSLQHKQDELSQFKKVEGRTEVTAQDAVVVKFAGSVGEHSVEHQTMIDLTDMAHEPLPGLSQALVGLPVDATDHEVKFSIPKDHPRKELAGRDVDLKVTFTDVKEKIVPALDDDFAKDTGEADTLADLKDKIRDRLMEVERQKNERDLKEQLMKELRARNPIDVSPGLVERQLDNVVERTKLQLQLAGVDIRNLDETRVREDLREVAADEVRGTLVLEAIAETEKVVVSEADLEKRLAELAAMRDSNVARLKAEYAKEGRLESLKHALREELTLDLVLSRATITDEAAAKKAPKKAAKKATKAAADDQAAAKETEAAAEAPKPATEEAADDGAKGGE